MMLKNPKSVRHMVLLGLLLSGLSACGYDRYIPEDSAIRPNTAVVEQPKIHPISSAQITSNPSLYYKDLSYRVVTVLPGDTLSKIAARHDVPAKSVIALNSSKPPFIIYVGQQVKVPVFKMHQVQGGETLYAISRVYDVEMGEVVHFNRLSPPYILAPGRALKIPQSGAVETRVASVGKTGWVVSHTANGNRLSTGQNTPLLKPNSEKSVSVGSLGAPTQMPTQGEFDAKPQTKPQIPPKLPAIRPFEDESKADRIATLPPLEDAATVGAAIPAIDLPPLPRNRYSIKQPPKRSGKIFYWPAKGPVVSAFGKKETGFHNGGINIKLKMGTPIKAAENGVVSYVGNEMRSFGNLILISHADGYVTTYGHVDQTNVRKGDAVRKGDVIATAGATGDVVNTQLHFEIRKNGTAKNPMRLLARR
ncbi:MAG: peptidoglycan DD-metalloendopeptidase family protein [Sneathiella sp.]|nr:peptidoglycan DD-metalloendopeptidase family protein [Sneathiella sp.]